MTLLLFFAADDALERLSGGRREGLDLLFGGRLVDKPIDGEESDELGACFDGVNVQKRAVAPDRTSKEPITARSAMCTAVGLQATQYGPKGRAAVTREAYLFDGFGAEGGTASIETTEHVATAGQKDIASAER